MSNSDTPHLLVATVCPKCSGPIGTDYILIGAPQRCNACGQYMIASIPTGTPLPVRQWELSYRDFEHLLRDSDYRAAVSPLLATWFSYAIKSGGDFVKIFARDGNEIDPLELHKRIQSNGEHQYVLYQTAMSLWR